MPSIHVEEYVLLNAGARPASRDDVDLRLINDVIHGTGRLINSQNEVGGWLLLEENKIIHVLPNNPHIDSDNDGYTNLEEWLHENSRNVEELISNPKDLAIKRS